jgi:hypothetical protein
MSVQRKNKTPQRVSPKVPSPRPSTPVLKNIGEVLEGVKEAMPAGGISTLGLTPAMVAPFVESQGLLKALLLMMIAVVFLICTLLWAFGGNDSKKVVQDAVGTRVPGYLFSAWFVFLFLVTSLLGFAYIIMHVSYMPSVFVVSCFVYLLSLVMIFYKLYHGVSMGSSAVQIWSFILIINAFFFGVVTTQYTNNFLLCIFAVLPTVIYGGFTLYSGGIISDNK